MSKDVVIIGAGGHAKVVADIVLCSGDNLVGFLDDDTSKQGQVIYKNYEVIGRIEDYLKFKDCDFVIAIGDNKTRAKIAEELDADWYTAIHPSVVIADTVKIGVGTVVMAGVVVNVDTVIGEHCIINTAAIVDHDNIIGNYVHISPGSRLAGTVRIGEMSWICAGVTIINNVFVGNNNIIGSGAIVIKDIEENDSIFVGIPAKKIKNRTLNQ